MENLATVLEKHGSCVDGLSEEEVAKRREEHGPNVIQGKKGKPVLLQFFEEFTDVMVLILVGAAIISYFSGDQKDTFVILFIIVLNATIGLVQKFKAEKAIEALKKLLMPKARVLRGGHEKIIPAKELVPGDILILNEGDKVGADGMVLEGNELMADESPLTGESLPVAKIPLHGKVFMGTQITHGTGKILVTATGMQTEFGTIARLTAETKKEKTPLEKELQQIGMFVGKVTLGISLVLVGAGLFIQHKPFLETLLFAASVAVAAVPEGLPATVTIALALGVQRLARKNAIIKQLSSVETLGSTTVICSDKTGTLTKAEMTVKEAIFDDYRVTVKGVGYEPKGLLHIRNHKTPEDYECDDETLRHIKQKNAPLYAQLEILARIAGLCNNAHLSHQHQKWSMLGDPTEGALLTFVEKAGFPAGKLRKQWKKIFEIPFDSTRKRMTVVVQNEEDGKIYALVKGAPEAILPVCTIEDAAQQKLHQENEEMAGRALRVIAFAWKELPSQPQKTYHEEEVEQNLQFAGLVGMIDPPREEVKEAVKLTHKAGIKVYIVTGDHGLTAAAIAKELGLVSSYQVKIVSGQELDKMSEEKLINLFTEHKDIIFARVSPEHKLRIVSALKARGEVVAVTGDGVNDAPALKRADIGIAMGITGTDVSKEAANMVLADDSFATIVIAIEEGRTIYENFKKFIFYNFSSNIGEVIVVFIPIMLFMPSPLTPILILLINVGTDVLPALALGVDPPERDIMNRMPRSPKSRIMNGSFILRFFLIGLFIGGVVTAGYFWDLHINSWNYLHASTFAFVLLIMIQMVNALNARSERASAFSTGLFSNGKLWGAIAISILLTIAFIEIPFLQQYLHVVPLNAAEWLMITAISFSVMVVEEARKWIMRTRNKRYAAI